MASLPGSIGQISGKDQFSPRSRFMELVVYDPKAYTLDITFKSGAQHRYLYCFPTTYQTFKESPTHDAYFSRAIRGKMLSVTIKSHNVGRQESNPLHEQKKRSTLDHGIPKWKPGTVARAGL